MNGLRRRLSCWRMSLSANRIPLRRDMRYRAPDQAAMGGNNEDDFRRAFRHAAWAPIVVRSRRGAEQGHHCLGGGGGACLCYLPTVLAKQLGEFDKAGIAAELVDLKGGSDALRAVIGGSADVVSGYFDHCVNLAAKKQELMALWSTTAIRDWCWWYRPSTPLKINSIKDLAGKKVGVSAPWFPRPISFSNTC